MKRKKYPIHPDFKKWAYFNPPLNPPGVFLAQKILGPLFYLDKSDKECLVERKIIKTFAHKIPIIIYTPKSIEHKTSPCIVNFHGGGFVLPASIHHYALAKMYAIQSNSRVIFVDYSLAPKHPFPKAVFECYKAYEWIVNNVETLNIDPNKIGVAGDSAGGQLCSDVCILAKRKGIKIPCLQLLMYPACTYGVETASMLEYTDTPLCNSKDSDKYLDMYLKSVPPTHPWLLNLIDADLSEMPPTYIETAQYDCLRDGAILFAEVLKQNNTEVVLYNTEGTIHGYDIELKSSIVQTSIAKRIEFLNTHFYKE